MDFKNVIIMSDLDGTLLDDKKEISQRDMESINEFCDKGGMFTIATGRGYSMARPVAQKLKLRIPVAERGYAESQRLHKAGYGQVPRCRHRGASQAHGICAGTERC